jgi:hypothetical protein
LLRVDEAVAAARIVMQPLSDFSLIEHPGIEVADITVGDSKGLRLAAAILFLCPSSGLLFPTKVLSWAR